MNKNVKKGSFFATATASGRSWREALAKMTGKPNRKPEAKIEIDDANGETLIFPEIGDLSELAEGVAVTATDGTHVFTADNKTYTVEVLSGAITSVEVVDNTAPPADEPAAEVNEDTQAFIEAVAQELEANETFRATAQTAIDTLVSDLATARTEAATAKKEFEDFKKLMGHKGDGTQTGAAAAASTKKIGGKTIDFSKINLSNK